MHLIGKMFPLSVIHIIGEIFPFVKINFYFFGRHISRFALKRLMKLIRQGLERGMFMTFGEKVKNLRKNKGLNQTQLADAVGVSLRTVRGWEIEGRYPKKHDLYQKLADILSCDISYLMTEEEAFITEASEQFGNRGAKQAQQILEQAAAMFAGGELSDEDKTAFMDEIQSLYLDSKRRAKKFTPKKYLDAK